MTKRLILVATVFMLVLVACETTVEPGEMAIQEGVCPRPHNQVTGDSANQAWGSVTPVKDGIEYTVNAGFTATLCAKGGPNHSIITVTGPASGFVQTPSNQGGNIPDLSHWSVTSVTGSAVATTTTEPPTTTTTAPETTTTEPEPTTTASETSTTEAGATTTVDEGTVPEAGATTTLAAEVTTTLAGEVTTTLDIDEGTLEAEPGSTTTTVEVGGTGDSADPGDPGDPSEETSTTVEVGAGSDTTLPYTGIGDMTMGGLAAILFVSGAVLLLLARRRSSED